MARQDTVVLIAQPGQQFKARLPDGLHAQLKAAAAIAKRSTNAEIIHRIEGSFRSEASNDLRDVFAGQAMAAIIIGNGADVSAMGVGAAKDAYAVADALLEARK